MKHKVQQVETLNKYAEYIHTLFCYKEFYFASSEGTSQPVSNQGLQQIC